MALVDNAWYVNFGNGSSTGYYAVTAWATGATIAAGALRRQLAAPAVGSERVFVCIVAGTTHATTEPTWVITRGGKTTDNTVTWQECTGIAALNGDATNTPSWTITATPPGGVKNTAVTLGQVIKRDNGASYWICTTAGTAGNGSEPAWANDTAGTTRTDNTVTWTCLGVVGNFTGWQAPHARLANSFTATWGQAGNSFFLATEHAEAQSSAITLTSPGAMASPAYAYSVTKTAVPPVSANISSGASISTTGATNLSLVGVLYVNGVTINLADAANAAVLTTGNATSFWQRYENCSFNLRGTGTSTWNIGATNGNIATGLDFYNTTFTFSAVAQKFNGMNGTRIRLKNCTLAGTAPTTLFSYAVAQGSLTECIGCDLSLLGSGKTIFGAGIGDLTGQIIDCKLGASVTVAATPTGRFGSRVDLIRCDSGATNYRTERYAYEGTQSVETTIVRTGGATDGTTPISWKLVTTANAQWVDPFESQPISIWNDSTSSVTVTIYGIWGGGAVPNNDDIWIEAEYLGSSATPLGSFATATKANNLATGSALTSDSSTWGGSTTKFKMSVTFTPGMKGPINLVVKAAKVSSTFYIDPKPEISGVTVSKSLILAPGVYANELQSGTSGMLYVPNLEAM